MPGSQPLVSPLITCEHASRAVPARWRHLFAGHRDVLAGHRGWDRGALALARRLAAALQAPLLAGRATRLLIDLNRSAGHRQRFSEWTRSLPLHQRRQIERDWWRDHWAAYDRFVSRAPGRVIHIACHSFSPVLDGIERRVDIGLLYDPARASEKRFCARLKREIQARMPQLDVRMNVPYRGTANGLGQQHRRRYGPDRLISVELELNQRLLDQPAWPARAAALVEAVVATVCPEGYLSRLSRLSSVRSSELPTGAR